ncbi:Type 1 glutamine amidotransferase-like domain-containing protein [Flavivirga aquimarina]|uniref:Type 1 glutamine amidotransferase-like domain-containing protein n=1 Tax=Flavivirga aquimarina TaxID=2027862 RepID=A0ABT8WA28_9FLAO|nr:Type 1 glutamine amidotransferase-like domain-containing protein [Flavivirga aquimarina]MDO5969946.1 Type 1 glutamine amidotransferase-like domain-containing protein [Flavivirga aquimarina]
MKYYLSSYKFGNKIEELKELIPKNNKIGHINNSRDWVGSDSERANKDQQEEIELLNKIGFKAEPLDLKEYFDKTDELNIKLTSLGGIWVSGGNTFVLRMAMKLSGFDEIFEKLINREDFLYGGYSAGICVLSESLKSIEIVDDSNNFPYKGINEPIYEGLGVFNYSFMPHYDSDHFESEAIGKEIQKCIDNK